MSNQFSKSNPELEAAVNGATTPQELREAMLSTLTKQGQIVRTRDDEFNNRLVPQAPETSTPQLDDRRDNRPVNAERVLYLQGNSRIVITSADGESALDAIEEKLRASLGSQR
jgi:hypothetical protein